MFALAMMGPPSLKDRGHREMQRDATHRRDEDTHVAKSFMGGALDERGIILTRNAGRDNPDRVAENRDRDRHNQNQSFHGPASYEEVIVQNAHENDGHQGADAAAGLLHRQLDSNQFENVSFPQNR